MIIGIIGKARAGKDTLASYLGEEFNAQKNNTYVMIAYALELKKRVQRDFDLSYEQLWGDLKEVPDLRYPKDGLGISSNPADYWSPREFLQDYGQFFRDKDINYWVKALFNVIEDKGYDNVIITDCRHANEVYPIIDRGGVVLRVSRPIEGAAQQPNHISEISLDKVDFEIDFDVRNEGTKDDLRGQAKILVPWIADLHNMKLKEID
ncbi:hypothetical protein DRQ25_01585 [Candidatus Fermentibacteria bacterium]|nr:MAG: hypothetical protein DRQ25_01585 [Candidatus Fermentibacteria bacterium]